MALLGLSSQELVPRLQRRSTSLGAVRQSSPLHGDAWEAHLSPARLRARSLAGQRPRREVVMQPSEPLTRAVEVVSSQPQRRALHVATELELRAQRRQQNFGTLRGSWLVKNCFSAWRTFVGGQVARAHSQMQQELQLNAVYELKASLAKKEEEIKRLLLEMERNERISGDRLEQLEQQLRRLRGELQGAREELLRAQYQAEAAQSRASAFHQWLRFTQEQRQATLESQLRELELLLQEAEQRLKLSDLEWRSRVELLEDSEARAQEEVERLRRRVEELEDALKDAEHQLRRSESEWKLKYQQLEGQWAEKLRRAQEELEKLRRRLEEEWSRKLGAAREEWELERDESKNVFELQLAKVQKQHEAQRRLQEEEDAARRRQEEQRLEELRRKQLEATQGRQMKAMGALMGKSAKGLLSLCMVAWVRYLNHARREKAEQQLELALSKKDQELQKLLREQQALQRSLKDREKDLAALRLRNRLEAAERALFLLGGDGLSYREALWLSQVLAAWLLVATALHWARARELYAGQADQLRLQLEELRRQNHLSMRNKLLSARELKDLQVLLSRVLREWQRHCHLGQLQAQGERSAEAQRALRARQERLMEGACAGLGRGSARQLLRSYLRAWQGRLEASRLLKSCKSGYRERLDWAVAKTFKRYMEATPIALLMAWSRAARQLRYERAAQQMLSKVDFLRRSKLMNRDAFLSRREDQSLRLLCRKVLSLWWQEAKALHNEKMRQQWSRAAARLGDRGANCGSRLAAKFWSLKMRLLLFASFMAWRFRLAHDSSAQLKKVLQETEAAHFAFGSRSLLLSDAFRKSVLQIRSRWRRWANDLSFQRSVSALLSRQSGPGRVLAVVSSIEEKRRRLICMETFLRWRTVLRWKSQSPSPRGQVLHPAWTVAAAPVIRAPQVVRAASCPQCGNVYLPDSLYCRRCGHKRDLLELTKPSSVSLPLQRPSSPTSITSIRPEDVVSPRSQISQLASPVRTELRSEPVAVSAAVAEAPIMSCATSPERIAPLRVVQSTPEHSPVSRPLRFVPRLNPGWPPEAKVLKSGSDSSLGPPVWRAAR